MLRHAIPSGDEAVLLDRAFTSLLVDLARTKFAAVENPQPRRGTAPGSRHIPAEVKRAVWVRDSVAARCGTDAAGPRWRPRVPTSALVGWRRPSS
jgi:hypothetical protein